MQRALKTLLSLYLLMLLAGVLGFFVLINLFSPDAAAWYVFFAVYLTIFIAAFGLGAIAVSLVQFFFGSRVTLFAEKNTSLRQGAFLGGLVTLGLLLQSFDLLSVFTAVLLVLTFAILELYFLNK